MFESRTLFVVGAGASCEAGLPSGESLKDKIASALNLRFDEWGSNLQVGDHQVLGALQNAAKDLGFNSVSPLLHKCWRIRDVVPAASLSIDNFIDAHRGDDLMELCGKLGIVFSILAAERSSKLRSVDRASKDFRLTELRNSWYSSFFNKLTEQVRKADVEDIFSNVSIITFNYDRCIERYLVQALSEYYDLTTEHAGRVVSTLRIYHPYGQVGRLHFQHGDAHAVPFGADNANYYELAKQVNTFSEGLSDNEMLVHLHDEVKTANSIVFLGFAFHPINMKLLTPDHPTQARRIFATTLGLSDADEAVIQNDIGKMLGHVNEHQMVQRGVSTEMAKLTCSDFFKAYFRSIGAARY